MSNGFQYDDIGEVAEALNCMDSEMEDHDLKAVLINACRRIAILEKTMRQAVAHRDVMD